jgi:hypothetical protein
MPIEIDATTFYGAFFIVIFAMRTINTQGGLKIVSWRIRGKRGFLMTMIEPDKKVLRKPLPMKIVHNSTPRFTFGEGEYFTGGPDETAYAFGMPNWVYMRGDSRPLKLQHTGELMSASKIHAAFQDDAIERFNGLKLKKSKVNDKLLMYLMIFILILSAASAMYSYYYGLNINCAVHTRACP